MNRTRVKICGITRQEDATAAIAAGADAIGLVFYEPSSRYVTVEQARAIVEVVPAFVTVVALTVNANPGLLGEIARLPVDLFQFHGDESPEQCEALERPFIKALRMKPGLDLEQELERFSTARSVLLDAYRQGVPGGTGESFDWELIPKAHRSRIVLAGGLGPQNVGRAVRAVRPYAVDVSGGVELAPGIKDAEKMTAFVTAVQQADSDLD